MFCGRVCNAISCCPSRWEAPEGSYGLPDAGDEHVVAAAATAGARAIVTHNLPRGIEAVEPSQFAQNVVALNPGQAWTAIECIAKRSGRRGPSVSAFAILELLESRYGMVEACCLLRKVAS